MSQEQNPAARLQQAVNRYKQGERDSALADLYTLVALYPDYRDAWWAIALMSPHAAQKQQAAERVLQLDPDHARAKEFLAKLAAAPAPEPDPAPPDSAPGSPAPPPSMPAEIEDGIDLPTLSGDATPAQSWAEPPPQYGDTVIDPRPPLPAETQFPAAQPPRPQQSIPLAAQPPAAQPPARQPQPPTSGPDLSRLADADTFQYEEPPAQQPPVRQPAQQPYQPPQVPYPVSPPPQQIPTPPPGRRPQPGYDDYRDREPAYDARDSRLGRRDRGTYQVRGRLEPFLVVNGGCTSGCFSSILTVIVVVVVGVLTISGAVSVALKSADALGTNESIPLQAVIALGVTLVATLLRGVFASAGFDPSGLEGTISGIWTTFGYSANAGDAVIQSLQQVGPELSGLMGRVPLVFFGAWIGFAFLFVFLRARSMRIVHWTLSTFGLWLFTGFGCFIANLLVRFVAGGG